MKKSQTYEVWYVEKQAESGLYEALAVFTEKSKADEYIKKYRAGTGDDATFSLEKLTTELKPIADNFNVPLDPKFQPASFKKVKKTIVEPKDEVSVVKRKKNPLDPQPVGKDEPVSALLGVTIGKRGGAGKQ